MKPIDWTKVKSGDRFTAEIKRKNYKGVVWVDMGYYYLTSKPIHGGYKFRFYAYDLYDKKQSELIKNLKIISQNKKPMAKKTARKKEVKENHETVKKWKAANGTIWEIIKTIDINGTSFFVRETSINGNILANGRGLNTKQSAVKSFNAIIAGAIKLKEVKIK